HGGGPATVEPHHVFPVDLVGRCRRDRQVFFGELAEALRALCQLAEQARQLVHCLLRRDVQGECDGGLGTGCAHAYGFLAWVNIFCGAGGKALLIRRSSRLSSCISRKASSMSARVGTFKASLTMPMAFCD